MDGHTHTYTVTKKKITIREFQPSQCMVAGTKHVYLPVRPTCYQTGTFTFHTHWSAFHGVCGGGGCTTAQISYIASPGHTAWRRE